MKKLVFLIMGFALMFGLTVYGFTNAPAAKYDSYVLSFHVISNSDSAFKRKMEDAIKAANKNGFRLTNTSVLHFPSGSNPRNLDEYLYLTFEKTL